MPGEFTVTVTVREVTVAVIVDGGIAPAGGGELGALRKGGAEGGRRTTTLLPPWTKRRAREGPARMSRGTLRLTFCLFCFGLGRFGFGFNLVFSLVYGLGFGLDFGIGLILGFCLGLDFGFGFWFCLISGFIWFVSACFRSRVKNAATFVSTTKSSPCHFYCSFRSHPSLPVSPPQSRTLYFSTDYMKISMGDVKGVPLSHRLPSFVCSGVHPFLIRPEKPL